MDTCVQRLNRLGAAGFRAVLNYDVWNASWEDLTTYAQAAQAAGVKIIWPFNNRPWRAGTGLAAAYPALAKRCGCSADDELLDAVMNVVRAFPSTWGYYVGDEVDPAEADQVKALADRVRASDDRRPLLYVAKGNSPVLGGDLKPFAATADVLASDIYVVGTSAPLSIVSDTSEEVQRIADGARKRSAAVLQAFNWAQYPNQSPADRPRFPTRDELLRQRNYALAGGRPSIILWYSLKDIANSDDPDGHFADLAAAAMAPMPVAPQHTGTSTRARARAATSSARVARDRGAHRGGRGKGSQK
jgi:hypothetical protein